MKARVIWGLAAAAALVAASLVFSGYVEIYLDIPTAVMILGLTKLVSLGIWGPKALVESWKIPFRRESSPEERQKAAGFWKSQTAISLAVGVLMVIQGVVGMMANLSNNEQLGPAFAMALLSLYYTALLNLLVYLPLRLVCEQKDYEQKE